jgi:hypothetical protein
LTRDIWSAGPGERDWIGTECGGCIRLILVIRPTWGMTPCRMPL